MSITNDILDEMGRLRRQPRYASTVTPNQKAVLVFPYRATQDTRAPAE